MTYDPRKNLKNWQTAHWRRKTGRVKGMRGGEWASHWQRWLVHPFLKAALEDLPCDGYSCLGPFGLSSCFSVYFLQERVKLFHVELRCSLSNGHVSVVDLSSNTGNYNHNSFGSLNGLNHRTREILSGESFLDCVNEFDALLPAEERTQVEASAVTYEKV